MSSGAEMTKGAALIAAERQRQQEAEGWSFEHDCEHGPNVLRSAARAYEAIPLTGWTLSIPQGYWPWGAHFWKPKGALRNLVRAGALYQAAIEVLVHRSPLGRNDMAFDGLVDERDRCARAIDLLLAEAAAVEPAGGEWPPVTEVPA